MNQSIQHNLSDYDTGLSRPNDLDREAFYRLGFWLEAIAANRLAQSAESTRELVESLTARETKSYKIRAKASDMSLRTAARRAGRSHKLSFVESENCIARFVRGQNQSAATTKYGVVRMVDGTRGISINTIRAAIQGWLQLVIQWACCADPNNEYETCPPFLHEVTEAGSGAAQ